MAKRYSIIAVTINESGALLKLPSVTTILNPWSDFSQIRPEVLELAADRGELVHSLLARHLLGLEIFPGEITPEVMGHFNSGRRWADKYLLRTVLVERELVDEDWNYIGHPDLIGELRGDQGVLSLWDWRGATYQITHAVQLGGYYGLARKAGYDVRRVGPLYLRKDGKVPNVSKHEPTSPREQDSAVLRCALTVWWRFNP